MRLLIVIPAYNEVESLPQVMTELREIAPERDYVIVNDGSGDQTAELCRTQGYHFLDLPTRLE